MDAKELRAEAALTEHSSDGGAKFALHYDRSKCHDTAASAYKADTAGSRPCAVIGPDRVVPPAREGPRKAPVEPWLNPDPVYRRFSDYPHKMSDHKDPTRNISPRQTFQENMQRIIMTPGYNAMKLPEDPTYTSKNNKLNVPVEVKYCDVPYNINPISDQKHIRNADHSASNVNPLLMRGVPHAWPAGSVNVRPLRPYGAPEMLQYPDYASCNGPRPVLTRTHTSGHEDLQQMYPDPYYHENNVRFKPYPNVKERYPQTRYEYLGNYSNPYHPPHPFAHKYELPKTMPPHTYAGYPPVPVKYTERIPDPLIDGYQRAFSQQGNYSVPIRNPVIHPPYRPMPGSHMQNKLHPYPPDGQHKPPVPNKLPYDQSSKMYLDYDSRSKPLPVTDNYYLNELHRPYHPKNTVVLPNYSASMHGVNAHPYYIKENMPIKNLDYTRFKNMDPSMVNHSLTKLPPQFSPSTLAISPADSNASNETNQTHGTAQEDCGYVSQSSVTSVRSIDSLNRIPMDPYGRYDYRYGPIVRASSSYKLDPNSNQGSKSKKDIRQFISSWSEGDDENAEHSAKREAVKTISDDKLTFSKQYDASTNQEQLYVLGLVNVPSEELSKYEHIQKVSKLPENIKGYNSLELLNQFEEAIESSNNTSGKLLTPRAVQMPLNSMPHKHDMMAPIPRAVSPLDVEAKISQSVIHKDVGCNFEIKPCSPKMLNVEVATPMQTLLNERAIEKVANPLNIKSPIVMRSVEENTESTLINKSMKCPVSITAPSCKLINNQHLPESSVIDNLKTNYSLQDLESNSGVCLASLPRLDTDIELNFPEVNQQFINANKPEPVITTSYIKDLPTLDVNQADNIAIKNALSGTEYDMNYQFSPKTETKLSKYRKLKRSIPDDNDTELAKVQAARVDSVIIKNPDNTRIIEENTDISISGEYFRNNSQEFAINLVSQAKNSKANHQRDIDKILNTPSNTVVTSRYDEISVNPLNNFAMHNSGNSLNKPFNVIEENTRNNIVHVQSEDLSMHSKDLSNRYLDKAALDMPMNLSPQAKYSMVGDEEATSNRSSEKAKHQDVISDIEHQINVEETCHNKNAHEKEKSDQVVNLHKFDDLQNENLNAASDTLEVPNKKLNIPDNCSSPDFSMEGDDVETDKKDYKVSIIEKGRGSPIKILYNEGESAVIKQIAENYVDETGEPLRANEMDQVFDSKNELGDNTVVHIDKANSNDTIDCLRRYHNILSDSRRKKHDSVLHVSKSKRKKHRAEVTDRKRSAGKKTETTCDESVKNKRIITQQNVKKSSHSKRENLSIQSKCEEPLDIISDEKKNTDSSVLSDLSTDRVKKETSSSDSGYLSIENISLSNDDAPKEDSTENVTAAIENVNKACSDLNQDNLSMSCLPINDEYFDKSPKSESKTMSLNSMPMYVDSKLTKYNEKDNTHMALPAIADVHLGNQALSKNDDSSGNTLFDEIESNEECLLQSNANINLAEKKLDCSAVWDQHENKKHASTSGISPNKNLETAVPLDQNEKQTKEKQINTCTILAENNFDTQYVTYQSDQQIKNQTNSNIFFLEKSFSEVVEQDEKQRNVAASLGNEMLDHTRKLNELTLEREELHLISSKNEDLDIQTMLTNNPFKVCSKNHTKQDLDQDVTNEPNDGVKRYVRHVHVNKELFSPRFQNLLLFNENCDSCTDINKLKLTDAQFTTQSTKIYSYDPVIQDEKICRNLDTEMLINGFKGDNVITDVGKTIVNTILNAPNKIENITGREYVIEKSKNETLDTKFDVTSTESTEIHVSVDSINAVEGYENETLVDNSNNNITPDMDSNGFEVPKNVERVDSSGENQVTINADTFLNPMYNVFTETSHKEIPNHSMKDLDRNKSDSELDLRSTNKFETDTYDANINVVDETRSAIPIHSSEYTNVGTVNLNNYEFDKKIQSFRQNLSCRPRFSLKRSLSDSALDAFDNDVDECSEKKCFTMPKKRKKTTDIGNIEESHLLNIIQSSRRNSISTLCNENFSFCILIDDNCIVTEENFEHENDFIQLEDDSLSHELKDHVVEDRKSMSLTYNTDDHNSSDTYIMKCDEEKSWVEDVGCEETIETEDIAENIVIGEPTSPKCTDSSDYESDDEDMGILNDAVDHTSKVKHIYGDNMCTDDAQLVDALYRTPQMDVNKKLMDRESQIIEKGTKYYDSDSLEMLLAEPIDNVPLVAPQSNNDRSDFSSYQESDMDTLNEEKVSTCLQVLSPLVTNLNNLLTNITVSNENIDSIKNVEESTACDEAQNSTIHSCESSLDNVFSYIHKEDSSYTSSSSPEVSSTTSEEKNSSILLKISNFKGSRISEVKSLTYDKQKENSCKFTEKEYLNPSYNNGMPTHRPLLTKAAQKYIPPLRETVPDLKVKLTLPQKSLLKLQKNKATKEEPKLSTRDVPSNIKSKEMPRKIKPKFEDVLKNIDEVQFQMHKEKNKKTKKYIPKVVIKKSVNGSHYASTSTKETFNPDLTGRKWQPWVFIEKNQFIDKMALRNKTRAVFSHRRKSFVLAEKFCKYKSVSSANFIISQPKINDFSAGNLKYTIKLKHTY